MRVQREGSGPEVLLVHGGASPRRTWRGLEPLAARWTLAYALRAPHHDFARDGEELRALLDGRPHVVAHSYGTLGALLAAGAAPGRVRSLTVIEPPLAHLLPDDPEAARLRRLGDDFLTLGADMDDAGLREFLRIAGAPIDEGPLPEGVLAAVRRARGGRLTSEARPPLAAIRAAAVPALVASGDHSTALERVCDHVAAALGAQRLVCAGAGHFVPAAPGFAEALERFLRR